MQEPSYHLEGVVRNRDELEDFTGPLDLILMLLSKNKIECCWRRRRKSQNWMCW